MSYELIGISVLWLFLYGYLIVASIDYGAGFFLLLRPSDEAGPSD